MRYKLVPVISVHRWHHLTAFPWSEAVCQSPFPRSPSSTQLIPLTGSPNPCHPPAQECLWALPQSSMSVGDDSLVLLYWDTAVKLSKYLRRRCFQQHFFPNIFSCGILRKTGKLLCSGRTAQCCSCSCPRAATFPRRPPAHHHYESLPALPRCPQFPLAAEMSSGKLA